MSERPSAPGLPSDATPGSAEEEGRAPEPEWRDWMRDLGRRQRRLREFLGLSQEQLARLAGVSQGAVSRLETARGVGTPLLTVLKVNAALVRELRGLAPTLLSADLRADLELQDALVPWNGGLAFRDLPLSDDPYLEELVRLYRETVERHRAGVLSVVRALVTGLKKTGSE